MSEFKPYKTTIKEAWCVFDGDGKPKFNTIRDDKTESILECICGYGKDQWATYKNKGYTCRKVEIREVGDD